MAHEITPLEMKRFIIETLELENLRPEDIGDDQPLFADGLGLDSIDAFELGIALRKKLLVSIDGKDPSTRNHFRTVNTLVALVSSQEQLQS